VGFPSSLGNPTSYKHVGLFAGLFSSRFYHKFGYPLGSVHGVQISGKYKKLHTNMLVYLQGYFLRDFIINLDTLWAVCMEFKFQANLFFSSFRRWSNC
jgi:hypothetical protein